MREGGGREREIEDHVEGTPRPLPHVHELNQKAQNYSTHMLTHIMTCRHTHMSTHTIHKHTHTHTQHTLQSTVEPRNADTSGTNSSVLIIEVSFIQGLELFIIIQ